MSSSVFLRLIQKLGARVRIIVSVTHQLVVELSSITFLENDTDENLAANYLKFE